MALVWDFTKQSSTPQKTNVAAREECKFFQAHAYIQNLDQLQLFSIICSCWFQKWCPLDCSKVFSLSLTFHIGSQSHRQFDCSINEWTLLLFFSLPSRTLITTLSCLSQCSKNSIVEEIQNISYTKILEPTYLLVLFRQFTLLRKIKRLIFQVFQMCHYIFKLEYLWIRFPSSFRILILCARRYDMSHILICYDNTHCSTIEVIT